MNSVSTQSSHNIGCISAAYCDMHREHVPDDGYTYTQEHIYIYAWMYIHDVHFMLRDVSWVCINYVCVRVGVCVCGCIYVCMYVCMCVHVHVHIMYINVHTYTDEYVYT